MYGKSSYDESDLSVLFHNDNDLIGVFLKLKDFYAQYCKGLIISGYCWNGEDIIGISVPNRPYIFYVFPNLKKIVFHNGHTMEFTYLLRDVVYRAAVMDTNGDYYFFVPPKVKTDTVLNTKRVADKKFNYLSEQSTRNSTQQYKKSKGSNNGSFGPLTRTGGLYVDDCWVPGLPSTQKKWNSKPNESGSPMTVTVDPSGMITDIKYE